MGPAKRPWACIEPHGRELRHMGAHGGAWTRTTAKGHAVAGAGFKAETLNWSEQEAFEDDSRQRDEEWRRMDVHTKKMANGNAPSAWTRILQVATQCNKQDTALSQGDRAVPLCRPTGIYMYY